MAVAYTHTDTDTVSVLFSQGTCSRRWVYEEEREWHSEACESITWLKTVRGCLMPCWTSKQKERRGSIFTIPFFLISLCSLHSYYYYSPLHSVWTAKLENIHCNWNLSWKHRYPSWKWEAEKFFSHRKQYTTDTQHTEHFLFSFSPPPAIKLKNSSFHLPFCSRTVTLHRLLLPCHESTRTW